MQSGAWVSSGCVVMCEQHQHKVCLRAARKPLAQVRQAVILFHKTPAPLLPPAPFLKGL